MRATHGMSDALIAAIAEQMDLGDTTVTDLWRHTPVGEAFERFGISKIGTRIDLGDTTVILAAERPEPIQIADLAVEPRSKVLDMVLEAGFRALLVVPLLGPDRIVGALMVRRRQPGLFPKATVDLLQTFAAQSVVAIQNARMTVATGIPPAITS